MKSITMLSENELLLISGGDGDDLSDATEELKEAVEDLKEIVEDLGDSADEVGGMYKMAKDFFGVFGWSPKVTAAVSAGSLAVGGLAFTCWKWRRTKTKVT